jgi:hypothetical protein
MTSWTSVFSGYRHSINEQRIDRWLEQFDGAHRDLAARVLDSVDFVTHEQMASSFRETVKIMGGWDPDPNQRQGNWRFVGFSVSSGESGDTMLHKFRLANRLTGKQYNPLFIHKSELLAGNLGHEDTVVFVDDFTGTGSQVTDAWAENIQELLPGNPRIFIVFAAASARARVKIETETSLTVISGIELTEHDDLFSSACVHFTQDEKDVILEYCRRSDRRYPRGYGDCGFLLVFAHNCPNNSIPILHAFNRRWEGLFRRYD